MPKSVQISGENDFEKLLKRLSDDIVKAPAFLRISKQLGEHFDKYQDEVCQAEFFWAMVADAVLETGFSRLARVYDKQKDALSLPTLLATIKANRHLFGDKAVAKRVSLTNTEFAQSIVPGSHFPDERVLKSDMALVSYSDTLVKKLLDWRDKFGAHVSSEQTIKRIIPDEGLPTQDEAFELCGRAFAVFNRYTSLFHAVHYLGTILGEEGSVDSVFMLLSNGLAAGRRQSREDAERLLKVVETMKQADCCRGGAGGCGR